MYLSTVVRIHIFAKDNRKDIYYNRLVAHAR